MYVRMYVCSHATKGDDLKKERERDICLGWRNWGWGEKPYSCREHTYPWSVGLFSKVFKWLGTFQKEAVKCKFYSPT